MAGDPVPDGAAFVACPATSAWTGESGAPLSEAPTADCEAGAALGLVAGDGTTVSFDLSQLAQAPVVDVVLRPSPTGESPIADTFTVDFEPPADSDVTTRGPMPAAPAVPSGTPSNGGSAAPAVGSGAGSGSPSFSPASPSRGSTAPAGPTVTVPPAGSPSAGTPAATTPATVAIGGEEAVAPPIGTTASSSRRWIGLVTAIAIIGLGAYLWRADRARAVMTAGPVLGGLGPFVHERSGPAPDVA